MIEPNAHSHLRGQPYVELPTGEIGQWPWTRGSPQDPSDRRDGTRDAAIVNLGSSTLKPEHLVPQLNRAGIKVIGHAGHKEKELHEIGRDLGCHLLVTNSELTHKLPQILQKV